MYDNKPAQFEAHQLSTAQQSHGNYMRPPRVRDLIQAGSRTTLTLHVCTVCTGFSALSVKGFSMDQFHYFDTSWLAYSKHIEIV